MKHLGAVLLATMLLAVAGEAGEVGRKEKPLVQPPVETTALLSVRLDDDVHAAAAEGYGDLRIVGPEGTEVPFIIRDVTMSERTRVRRQARGVVTDAKPLPDGSLEMTVTLGDEHGQVQPAGFTLTTPLHDFKHRVSVAWSAGDGEWTTLVEDALIYDYAQFLDVRDVTVDLPAAPADRKGGRYRIVISDATQEQQSRLAELTRTLAAGTEREVRKKTIVERRPFRIDGIQFWYTAEIEQRATTLLENRRTSAFRVARDADERSTRITVETRRQPVTEFTIVTEARNFSRPVRVEQPIQTGRDRRRRGPIASATVTRIDVAGMYREQLAIPLPESRLDSYDIVIDDGDNPTIDVTGVRARGPSREIVFLAEPGHAYRLAYGGGLAAPRYDTAAIHAALVAGGAVTPVSLGAESAVAAPPRAIDPSRVLGDGRLQIAVIAVLALLLAVVLFSAAKRVDAAPRNQTSHGS